MIALTVSFLLFMAVPNSNQIQTVGPFTGKTACTAVREQLRDAFTKMASICIKLGDEPEDKK